jgi:hypothetical protein
VLPTSPTRWPVRTRSPSSTVADPVVEIRVGGWFAGGEPIDPLPLLQSWAGTLETAAARGGAGGVADPARTSTVAPQGPMWALRRDNRPSCIEGT